MKKMKTVIEIKWRLREIFGKKLSFKDWHKEIFGVPASRKALKKIEENDNELAEMKKEVLAARDKAAA
jgi:hypothetical protein